MAGDGDRILQIVSNLVENAVRWTPAGGIVRLSAARRDAAGVRIEVADSGPGRAGCEAAPTCSRRSSREGGGGTGLGLAIASELALAMGGSLSVDDAPEGGALFICVLPRASAAAPRPLVSVS